MPPKRKSVIELSNSNYVPISKNAIIWYGGSQLWLPALNKSSIDYRIHNNGSAIIALADIMLYLALEDPSNATQLTNIAMNKAGDIYYDQYIEYLHQIDMQYIRTKNSLPLTGKKFANAFNQYAKSYRLKLFASWKKKLTYYDMYEAISEMLSHDIPVLLSIGPNTPNLRGKHGISFYNKSKYIEPTHSDESPNMPLSSKNDNDENTHSQEKISLKKPSLHKYSIVETNINRHYICVTGLIKDSIVGKVMLRVSSWGIPFYINYEEYRDYISEHSNTAVSSLLYIKKQ